MLAIFLVAIGTVGAATGFTLIGTSMAMTDDHDLMTNVSWVLIIAGIIMAIIGAFWYRANEARLEEERLRAEAISRR